MNFQKETLWAFAEFAQRPAFTAAIIYEDVEAGAQARSTYDKVAGALQIDCHFNFGAWSFDILEIPRLSEIAGQEAASSDMVIISLRGRNEPGPAFKKWASRWLITGESSHHALVGMVDQTSESRPESRAWLDYLRKLADRNGAEFFWHYKRMAPAFQQLETLPWQIMDLGEPANTSLDHWGLNE